MFEENTEPNIEINIFQWLSFLFISRNIHTIHSTAVGLRT